MPWKERDVMNLRTEFVLRSLREGINFRELCLEYSISPKTGYKWQKRFISDGISGLADRSRRPSRSPYQLPEDTICKLIRFKRAHPSWGPKKIRDLYARKYGKEPSESSVKRIFQKSGYVKTRKRRQAMVVHRIENRIESKQPNDVWTVDFKGWWRCQDNRRCEPLTVRDDFSKYVFVALPLSSNNADNVKSVFERLFKQYGLPKSIRSDNGIPFAHNRSILGISLLSAWFIALDIQLDRIQPGCPYQNGGHERMHRDIRLEVQGLVEGNFDHHRESLEIWRKEFNQIRPHEALQMKTPAEVYVKSERKYRGTPDRIEYPDHFLERKVSHIGTIRLHDNPIFISSSLRGWNLGLEPVIESNLHVYFNYLFLGEIDLNTVAFTPINPIQKNRKSE